MTTTEEGLAKLNARQKMAYWEVQKELEREMDLAEIEVRVDGKNGA